MAKPVLLLVHELLVPPTDIAAEPDRYECDWITEYDVKCALEKLGHEVIVCGIDASIAPLESAIKEHNPQFVFNLLEQFNNDPKADYQIVALLEMLGVKYSGCNPKGLLLARDKALSKKILKYHKIPTPNFLTFPKKKRKKIPKSMRYPAIVKCLSEEASLGIAQASIVHSKDKMQERIQFIHESLDQDAIVEDFIPGQEIYVGITGEKNLSNLPLWELKFEKAQDPSKEIYSRRAKWNEAYRERKGIDSGPATFTKALEERIIKICKRTYHALNLNGYARIDLRITEDEKIYVIEANPNPNIAWDDEFAKSAQAMGIEYVDLIKSLCP